MMRVLFSVVAAAGLLLGSQTAHGLSINPDPVNQTRTGLNANVSLVGITGNSLSVQVSVTSGTMLALDVSMLFDDLALPTVFSFVTAASTIAGPGVNATAIAAVTEANFLFGAGIGAGQTSDVLVITFDAPIAQGFEGAFTFDNGIAVDSAYAVVPEPSVAVLFSAGLVLLGIRRRNC
jgi:hypothetical protein